MMLQVLLSMFGILIVYRNLSLLLKFELMSLRKSQIFFIFLQLPLYVSIVFKEQSAFLLIYIGIFLIILIFYRKILNLLAISTYENCHLQILDQLLLLLKSGKSAQSSLRIVLSGLSAWEKLIFSTLQTVFEIERQESKPFLEKNEFYFRELQIILRSQSHVIEQLRSFRDGLRIQRNLRHKSRQVSQQIRAQAVVSIAIYIGIYSLSSAYFDLKKSPALVLASVVLFLIGFGSIFLTGGRIKWKT